ncbi:MAG: hypothetical protein KGZ59_08315 [Chitinophagaceae bacterium]|nr:hypothetical protein [Chitinophagaceae bacterium]
MIFEKISNYDYFTCRNSFIDKKNIKQNFFFCYNFFFYFDLFNKKNINKSTNNNNFNSFVLFFDNVENYDIFFKKIFKLFFRNKIIFNKFFLNFDFSSRSYIDCIDSSRFFKKKHGALDPFRVIKVNFQELSGDIFFFKLNFSKDCNFFSKDLNNSIFYVIKQKKYKRKKVLELNVLKKKTSNAFGLIGDYQVKTKNILFDNSIFVDYISNSTEFYRMIRKNKKRNEISSVILNKRIIRTNKTLVIPAHTNVTLITNSFDIVHS